MSQVKKFQKFVFLMSCLLAGVLSYIIYSQQSQSNQEEDLKAKYLPAGDFSLQSTDGPKRLSDFKGQPTLLYFGFTSCPDICPLGLATIRDALKQSPELSEVKALFVSVDPERDTIDVLSQYTEFFHPNIVPMRGTLEETASVAKQYGTYFVKAPLPGAEPGDQNADKNAYTVDHTAYYFVIDKEGQLKRVLEHNAKAEDIAEALLKLT